MTKKVEWYCPICETTINLPDNVEVSDIKCCDEPMQRWDRPAKWVEELLKEVAEIRLSVEATHRNLRKDSEKQVINIVNINRRVELIEETIASMGRELGLMVELIKQKTND